MASVPSDEIYCVPIDDGDTFTTLSLLKPSADDGTRTIMLNFMEESQKVNCQHSDAGLSCKWSHTNFLKVTEDFALSLNTVTGNSTLLDGDEYRTFDGEFTRSTNQGKTSKLSCQTVALREN